MSNVFMEALDREILLAEQGITAFCRDYMADRMQGLFEGPYIEPMRNPND